MENYMPDEAPVSRPKLDKPDLDRLIKLRNESTMYAIRSRTTTAQFNEHLAEAVMKLGLSIDESTLCMTCGTLRSSAVQTCPVCVVAPK